MANGREGRAPDKGGRMGGVCDRGLRCVSSPFRMLAFISESRVRRLVDQPAGTGFSYAPSNKFDHELPEVGLIATRMRALCNDYPRPLRISQNSCGISTGSFLNTKTST